MNILRKSKNIFIVIMFCLLVLVTGCAKTEEEKMDRKFRRIKVGMDAERVTAILGKPAETYTINENYVCDYWFIGATSIQDAQSKSDKGKHVKYYGVIYFTTDLQHFEIMSKEDIIQGKWGIS